MLVFGIDLFAFNPSAFESLRLLEESEENVDAVLLYL
jgi:hypothetical protein